MPLAPSTHSEERTARLTVLIDPRKKAVFERLCEQEDLTSSQVVRRMIRSYIEERLGRPWSAEEEGPLVRKPSTRRSRSRT
jgi:hypothetical protein